MSASSVEEKLRAHLEQLEAQRQEVDGRLKSLSSRYRGTRDGPYGGKGGKGRDEGRDGWRGERRDGPGGYSGGMRSDNMAYKRGRDFESLSEPSGARPRRDVDMMVETAEEPGPKRKLMSSVVSSVVVSQPAEQEEDEAVKPKLSSTIVPVRAPEKPTAPAADKSEEGKKRNRRMFGVLMGTLKQAQKENTQHSALAKQQSLKQKAVDEKLHSEKMRLLDVQREMINETRQKEIEIQNQIKAKQDEAQLALLSLRWTQHKSKLASFLRTTVETGHQIYYMPVQLNPSHHDVLEQQTESARREAEARESEVTEQVDSMLEDSMEDADNNADGGDDEERAEEEEGGTAEEADAGISEAQAAVDDLEEDKEMEVAEDAGDLAGILKD